ncbi:linoleate 9S-lipoxygenase 5-like isoform X1 [Carya illinoinensis]|uniref:Lipoxygenase n=2 Tax=Carya illinoinensis TaxID=32201 RepID=A0A8T1NAX6_CARIL|nr:linoleate 9S-lipoxygenase 5-like isoform X1 [Carya illinoinensis]KAG6628906.1 hypothetical protein CIPAW_14G045200 [Carya illinoinensis]
MEHQRLASVIKGEVVIIRHGHSVPGKSVSVHVCSCTEDNPGSGRGRLSESAYLKQGKSNKINGIKTTTYKVKLHVDPEFGIPGALVIKSQNKHKFFIESASLQAFNQTIHFNCNSWMYPFKKTKADRVFFSNTSYLPDQTPSGLMELRKSELKSLRGKRTGERKEWDRIYDYDCYNDLGNPDKGRKHTRPVLGGSVSHPYPRRLRTGRPPSNEDLFTESHSGKDSLDIYVPPDERFSPKKLSAFILNSFQATIHFLSPEEKSLFQQDFSSFHTFEETHRMFSSNRSHAVEEWVKGILKKGVPEDLYREVIHASKKNPLKFPLPQIIAENGMAWLDDEEFGRQMLAGINPTRIQCLEVFPPQDKNGVRSSIKRSHIEHNLGDLTVVEAMNQWRLFILDHHDYLMPYISRINTKGVCVYASRTLLFLRSDDTLKPIAIELSLTGSNDGNEINRVFVPSSQGTEAALWQLAKAHVATNDSVYHHLISHWLQTHAIVEPFIIATRRQLSEMHPIHRLLNPHFKDTMHINALARRILINSGGILEKILFSGEVSMKLSSELYKRWRFDEQGLPADLVKRGMALEDEDPNNPTGVQLLFEDYPYGADGLEIWTAIKTWVTEFCSIFYEDNNSVETDSELQAWWWEIQYVGHGDKCHKEWWYQMTTCSTLIETLTILIWIASAIHASVNFGQYAYAGYPPNRPTLCRKFIPKEGTFEYAEFLKDPDKYYLKMLPDTFEMSIGVALVEVLSWHTSDEVYLGQRPSEWTDNEEVRHKFEKFNGTLKEIEGKIMSRNGDPKLKNRWGPAKVPFNGLYPDTSNIASKVRITGKGIPNSISI